VRSACVSRPNEYAAPRGCAGSPSLTTAPRQPEQSTITGAVKRPSAVCTTPSVTPVTALRRNRAWHCASSPWQNPL
jgi:hypothetical protein